MARLEGFFYKRSSIICLCHLNFILDHPSSATAYSQPRGSTNPKSPSSWPHGVGTVCHCLIHMIFALTCSMPDYDTTFPAVCAYLKTECLSVTNVPSWFFISLPWKVLEQTKPSWQHEEGNVVTKAGCGTTGTRTGESLPLHFPSLWPYFNILTILDCHVTSPKSETLWNLPCGGSYSLFWLNCPVLLKDGAGDSRVWQMYTSHK